MSGEFITQDGNRIYSRDHEPEVAGPSANLLKDFVYHCSCHKRMGNDFWFLPSGQCLRSDRACDAKVPL